MALIEFKNITKEYSGKLAAENVSFKINVGEFVFLVGQSGAGKSTLIKMLIKEMEPSAGEILVDGQNIFEMSHEDTPALRRRIGVVFQDFKLLDSKTVFENVAIALEVVDASQEDIKNIVPNVLGLVGLLDKADSYPNQLSGGEKQRIAMARAIAHEPDVIVADEPTGMIDPKSSDEIMEVFEKVNSLGTTILMATHEYTIVDKMKKRVIRLQDGKLVSDKLVGTYNE